MSTEKQSKIVPEEDINDYDPSKVIKELTAAWRGKKAVIVSNKYPEVVDKTCVIDRFIYRNGNYLDPVIVVNVGIKEYIFDNQEELKLIEE